MKLFCWLCFLLLTITSYTYTQSCTILQQKVSLKITPGSLEEAITQLLSGQGVNYSFSSSLFEGYTLRAKKKVKKQSLESALNELLKSTDIEYLCFESQLIFRKKNVLIQHNPQQKFTISGTLRDRRSGELIIGALITVEELYVGAYSNAYGFFSLTLPSGIYKVKVQSMGFKQKIVDIQLNKNVQVPLYLDQNFDSISAVIVYSDTKKPFDKLQNGSDELSQSTLIEMPGYLGNADVIKSLHTLPGVKSYGDGSTFFYVRGGDRDQNLILVDEAPVYNPSHLLGFFSSFDPESFNDVRVYKSEFPAQFGGRLSSVVDIRTRDGNMYDYGGSVGVGFFSSKASIEGPMDKGNSSFYLSGRRSNLEWYTTSDPNNLRVYFYDISFKTNIKLSDKDRLYFSFYTGTDNLTQENEVKDRYGLKWLNQASTLRWNRIHSRRLFSNTTFLASEYNYYLLRSSNENTLWQSYIGNITLKTDYTYYLNPSVTANFGLFATRYLFSPGNLRSNNKLEEEKYPVIGDRLVYETGAYIGITHKISNKFTAYYGVRLPVWMNVGSAVIYTFDETHRVNDTLNYSDGQIYNKHITIEPRINFKYSLTNNLAFKISYNRNAQFAQLLSNSISPFTTMEVWYPAGANLNPQECDHYSAALLYYLEPIKSDIQVESYYKHFYNQSEYKDHASTLLNPLLEGELRNGYAWAYGMEILIKKDVGDFNYAIAYSLSKVFRKIKGVNNDQYYPAQYDRPHDINVFASHPITRRLHISANWFFTSGAKFTEPIGFYSYQNYQLPIYKDKNNRRLPNYHRLDISAKYILNKTRIKNFEHSLSFSLYNVYFSKNAISINFNKLESEQGGLYVPSNRSESPYVVPSKIFLLGFVPTINYNMKF